MEKPLILVVALTVRRAAASEFARFERNASAIMSRHGGKIERVIRLAGDETEDEFREVHILCFRDEAAFENYREDPRLIALRDLRAAAIVHTEIARGRDAALPGLLE